jgi:hypothetical protein
MADLEPSELALRDWVGPQLDASMVEEIAAADYGVDVAGYRQGVEDLRRGPLPGELLRSPAEVLSLTRWSAVDELRAAPMAARRMHLMRLFSCLFLVRAATADGMPVNALTPLVESAVELGPDAVAPATRFVAWCRVNQPGDWRDDPTSRPILTLALVVLSTQLPRQPTPDPLPGLLASFVEELAVALTEENLLWSPRPVPALLKRTAMAESRRAWVSLAQRCLVDWPAPSTARGARLTRLGQAIRGELEADADELRELLT